MLNRSRFFGLLAILAAVMALTITLPFAAAYFRAYGGSETPPFWFAEFVINFQGILDFAGRARVYQLYGMAYSLVIPLSLPAMLLLKKRIPTGSSFSLWAMRIFFTGVIMFGIGVFGDYWPDPNSFLVGAGFLLEMLGSLVIWAGGILFGLAALRIEELPRWIGYGLIGFLPLAILAIGVTKHIPAGPLFGYVVFNFIYGWSLLTGFPKSE